MKKIKCLDCEQEFKGENPKDVLDQMHPHYMKDHQDVMKEGNEEKRKVWFENFNKNWENNPEV